MLMESYINVKKWWEIAFNIQKLSTRLVIEEPTRKDKSN